MAAIPTPDNGLPTNPQEVTIEYVPGVGETETRMWNGTKADVESKYTELKSSSDSGGTYEGNTTGLSILLSRGRAKLMQKLERNETQNVHGTNIKVVEELYAVDLIKDIETSPYFSTAAATKLTDDEVVWVRECVDKNYDEDQIDVEAVKYFPAKPLWAAWSASMKQLRYHLNHKARSFYETSFMLRRSLYGVHTSQVQASYVGINLVCVDGGDATHQDIPEFQSPMDALIAELPSGEWLYRPPQAEHLGKGKWRITQEYQWAEKWSVIYDGTWGL